ncbi:short-chain dehydrogenase TIC 32, chloroplastic-like [Wolffia australiana]
MLETARYLLGYPGSSGFGSNSTAELVIAACPDLTSITAIVTGATSGIGEETARVLATKGARLVLPARRLAAAAEARRRIAAAVPGADVIILKLDLSSLRSVRRFVARFLSLNLPLHLLVNNAGRFPQSHALSANGVEMTFATNYLGHFLLTKLLLEKMVETATESGVEGRIVNVTSNIHGWFSGDPVRYLHDLNQKNVAYDATKAYALSKLAMVLHARELAKRLKRMGAKVTANCVHPGVVKTRLTRDKEGISTDLAFFLASKLIKSVSQAAATTCYVAAHPQLAGVSGRYFIDCNEAAPSKLAADEREAARLWLVSEAIVSGGAAFLSRRLGPDMPPI